MRNGGLRQGRREAGAGLATTFPSEPRVDAEDEADRVYESILWTGSRLIAGSAPCSSVAAARGSMGQRRLRIPSTGPTHASAWPSGSSSVLILGGARNAEAWGSRSRVFLPHGSSAPQHLVAVMLLKLGRRRTAQRSPLGSALFLEPEMSCPGKW